MRLRLRHLRFATGWPFVAVLNREDAKKLGVHAYDRIRLSHGRHSFVAIVDLARSQQLIAPGEIMALDELFRAMGLREGESVSVKPEPKPASIQLIRKKIKGFTLSREEIFSIIRDTTERRLSEIELTYFVNAIYINGLTDNEVVWLTEAMVETGRRLRLHSSMVLDKHCIGGIPGNRTTMVIVPIIAANGLIIPKTSSRSITSPAGTADSMEVLARVSFDEQELKHVVERVGGCIAWGGSVRLAPADDQIIRVEHPLALDVEGQMLASVISKKVCVGATHLLIDLPFGKGAKCHTYNAAKRVGERFLKLTRHFRIHTHLCITDGSQPIGNGIGPALEAIDVMKILENEPDAPLDLKAKCLHLAGLMLEMAEKAKPGEGFEMAWKTVESGQALRKMNEIIDAQGRNVENHKKIKIGRYKRTINAARTGRVREISNPHIAEIARIAGAPSDKGAGVLLHAHVGDKVESGQPLFTIYSESRQKLGAATKMALISRPFK